LEINYRKRTFFYFGGDFGLGQLTFNSMKLHFISLISQLVQQKLQYQFLFRAIIKMSGEKKTVWLEGDQSRNLPLSCEFKPITYLPTCEF
jgi:hypothetical protein